MPITGFNNIDYNALEDIYIKPNEIYNTHTIDKLTFALSSLGKGIMDGLDVFVDISTGNITVQKGVILVDNCVIKFRSNVTFNLTDFDNYSGLTPGIYYLIFYYQYDINNPDEKGVFDLISESEYIANNYSIDPKYVILTMLTLVNL